MTRQRGFTILEVLVGFLISALLLSVILSAFSNGMTNLARADRYSQAALVAQSRLAEVGISSPLVEGSYQGYDEAGYSWQVDIVPMDWELAPQLRDQGAVLYQVQVFVSWRVAGRVSRFVLSSLRIANQDAAS